MENQSELKAPRAADYQDPEVTAGKRLRELRINREWSQRRVADEMAKYGYEWRQSTVGKIEAAARPLRFREAVDLAALFGVNLSTLLADASRLTPEAIEANIVAQEERLAEAQKQIAAARVNLDGLTERRERAAANVKEWERVAASAEMTLELLRQAQEVGH